MGKVIINEKQLEMLVNKLKTNINEGGRSGRYMFFSNLEQIKRQCDILLDMNEDEVTQILENGHDWAQDHIAESKNNLDQVFDFLMNEIKTGNMGDYGDEEETDDEEEYDDDDYEFGDNF